MPAIAMERVLLTLVLISTPQVINRCEFAQGVPESINAVDIHTEVEYTVESVAVVVALIAGHSRA